MTVGNKTFLGLAVPINGEAEITQITAATDILTITGAGGQSGDFLVCRTSAGTEKFTINPSGDVENLSVASGKVLNWHIATTALTTGLVAGDMYVLQVSTAPQIGICISAAGNTCYYIMCTTTAS